MVEEKSEKRMRNDREKFEILFTIRREIIFAQFGVCREWEKFAQRIAFYTFYIGDKTDA